MTWMQEWPTGSAYIGADPDKGPQDIDFLRYVPEEYLYEHVNDLIHAGWDACGTGYVAQTNDKWCAYRRGDENLILCWCPLVYLRWVAFSELAKLCGLVYKPDRIDMCKAVLEGDVEAARNIVLRSDFNALARSLMKAYRSECRGGVAQ